MHCRFKIVGYLNTPIVKGKKIYKRLLIKKVKEEEIKEINDVALLMQYNKKFLIIGNSNAITYKEIFPLIKENQLWLGISRNGCGQMYFRIDDDAPQAKGQIVIDGQRMQTIGSSAWFTNLDHSKRHEELDLYKKYNEEEFPKYDNYDAIEVGKVCEIPMDYDGVMGVPITFIGKYCPTQFEIKGIDRYVEDNPNYGHRFHLNGKEAYARILIKRVSK